jgi:hypothetical protein
LPSDRSNNGGNQCPQQTSVEKVLQTIGDSKNGWITFLNIHVDGCDMGNHKEAKSNTDLPTNHEP